MKPSSRLTAASLLSALAVSPLVTTALGIAALMLFALPKLIDSPVAAVVAITFLGYLYELLFALPLYVLFKRDANLRAWHFIGLGVLATCAVTSVLGHGENLLSIEMLVVWLVPFGAVLGLVLWLLASRLLARA